MPYSLAVDRPKRRDSAMLIALDSLGKENESDAVGQRPVNRDGR